MSTKLKLPKLPKAFKKKWVAALRSGKYKQGKSRLYNTVKGSYCCLGVACRVAGISNYEIQNLETIPDGMNRVPKMLQGTGPEDSVVNKLTTMNDGFYGHKGEGRSFKWIAAYIERYL